jgi:GTPase SAR1 family protein
MTFFETSAMTDVNVEEAFMTIARQVKDRLDSGDPATSPTEVAGKSTKKLNKKNLQKTKKKGGCC